MRDGRTVAGRRGEHRLKEVAGNRRGRLNPMRDWASRQATGHHCFNSETSSNRPGRRMARTELLHTRAATDPTCGGGTRDTEVTEQHGVTFFADEVAKSVVIRMLTNGVGTRQG